MASESVAHEAELLISWEDVLKGHSQLMPMHVTYHFLTVLHITGYAIIAVFNQVYETKYSRTGFQ